MAITGVRIDGLPSEVSPTLDHVLPSMHEGEPSQLSVAQIVELARVLIKAEILGGAPGQLDTLDELAAALSDDANFAATITAALAGKQPLDSDLTALAALATQAFGRSLLTQANAQAVRTLIGLPLGFPMIHVQDQKSAGASAGASVAAAYQRRTLNAVVHNSIAGAALSADRVNLPAGTYFYVGSAPGYRVDRQLLALRNDTTSSYLQHGPTGYTIATNDVQTEVRVSGRFTLSSTADVELSHYTQTLQAVNGLGIGSGSGAVEVYADLKIWRLDP